MRVRVIPNDMIEQIKAQDKGAARIQGLPGYMGCQDTGAARILGLSGYRCCPMLRREEMQG